MQLSANIHKFLLLPMLIMCACSAPTVDKKITVEPTDADNAVHLNVLADGQLDVLMSNDVSSYYIFKGQPRGFEYDMLKLFCKDNGFVLNVKVIKDFDYLLDSLVAGKGDLAAGNITVTKARKTRIDFSPELLRTRQILVQRLPENYRKLSSKQRKARMVQDALDLDGKSVYVNAGSSFYQRLKNYADENGVDIKIHTVNSELGTDELVRMVANGEIDFTVIDENVGKIHKGMYPNLDFSVPVSLSQNIAWAIPKGNIQLQKLLESWMEKRKKSTRYNMIYNRYFGSKSHLKVPENYMSVMDGQISPYDDLIKEHANYISWDWLLLASLINKESQFNPNAESEFGAKGLMQVLPTTAERFGVAREHLAIPAHNVKAGTRFLQYLDQFWYKRLENPEQIKYYVLASYNAGPGHVLDAMYLAEKYGLDPQIWHNNVEVMLRNKSQPKYYKDPVAKRGYCNGQQPVEYVEKIMRYYTFYQAFQGTKNNPNNLAVR